ncbi:MAG: response regulator [Nostoc sp.]|uniref:response regulator n=1 Tax=Nostoc sp. TaxID=1180 RepID=UPI002FF4D53B
MNWREIATNPPAEFRELEEYAQPSVVDIDALVQQVRSQRFDKIQDQCGILQLLDISRPVAIDDLYIDVNILEEIASQQWLEITERANVISAGSVKEALETLSWFTPNIIVCEIRFLGESTYTLLNTLNAIEADNGKHIPIIVTSTSTTGTCDQIPDVEFEEYLLKPFDLDEFVSMIVNQVEEKVMENFCTELLILQ